MVQQGGLKDKDSLTLDSLVEEKTTAKGCTSQRQGESMV